MIYPTQQPVCEVPFVLSMVFYSLKYALVGSAMPYRNVLTFLLFLVMNSRRTFLSLLKVVWQNLLVRRVKLLVLVARRHSVRTVLRLLCPVGCMMMLVWRVPWTHRWYPPPGTFVTSLLLAGVRLTAVAPPSRTVLSGP